MIYLISQVIFIFLNQIYYNANFITSSSNFITRFPCTLRSIFANCFWRTIFCSTQKMHVSEYVCKTCLRELSILFKCREIFCKKNQKCKKKNISHSVQKLLIFHRIPLFHFIKSLFYHSISYVVLIDKPNERNEKVERNALSTTKKAFKKKRKKILHQQ